MKYSVNYVSEMNGKFPITNRCHNKDSTIKEFVEDSLTQGCVMLCNFKNEVRAASNANGCSLLGFDFDKGTSPDSIRATLSNMTHVVIASQSHMIPKKDEPALPRFHVFVPIKNIINSAVIYKSVWGDMNKKLEANADGQAKDISRLFAKHKEIIYVHKSETYDIGVDVARYEEKLRQEEYINTLRLKKIANQRLSEDFDRNQAARTLLQKYGKPSISGQSGHSACFSAACLLRKCGLSVGEIYNHLRTYNQMCIPRWTDKDLRHKAEQAYSSVNEFYEDSYLRRIK
jgi:hypothetical protein